MPAIVAESLQVAKQVEAEGIVLLKNEDGGAATCSRAGCQCLWKRSDRSVLWQFRFRIDQVGYHDRFYDALSAAGITYNDTLYQSYRTWYGKNGNHKEMPVASWI